MNCDSLQNLISIVELGFQNNRRAVYFLYSQVCSTQKFFSNRMIHHLHTSSNTISDERHFSVHKAHFKSIIHSICDKISNIQISLFVSLDKSKTKKSPVETFQQQSQTISPYSAIHKFSILSIYSQTAHISQIP